MNRPNKRTAWGAQCKSPKRSEMKMPIGNQTCVQRAAAVFGIKFSFVLIGLKWKSFRFHQCQTNDTETTVVPFLSCTAYSLQVVLITENDNDTMSHRHIHKSIDFAAAVDIDDICRKIVFFAEKVECFALHDVCRRKIRKNSKHSKYGFSTILRIGSMLVLVHYDCQPQHKCVFWMGFQILYKTHDMFSQQQKNGIHEIFVSIKWRRWRVAHVKTETNASYTSTPLCIQSKRTFIVDAIICNTFQSRIVINI